MIRPIAHLHVPELRIGRRSRFARALDSADHKLKNSVSLMTAQAVFEQFHILIRYPLKCALLG
jgi:hypothetical protein